LADEAENQGCKILGAGRTVLYRTYRLPCGHHQEVRMEDMRKGQFRCSACLEPTLEADAKEQGCEVIGPGKDNRYRTFRLPCGHEQQLQVGHLRSGGFRCRECFQNKLKQEAEAHGCEILGPGKNAHYRTYLLSYGHKQNVHVGGMRLGNFRCQTCEDYFYTQPSNAYLLHIRVGADEWLKLGYAKDVDFRTTRYGLPSEAEVSVLATLPFDTGKEAQEFERALHKKHKRKRLRAKDMLVFHTGGGATECYPLTMVEKLMLEMKADTRSIQPVI